MTLLKRLLEDAEEEILLTDTQKAILLLIFLSETPTQAYEMVAGSSSSVTALHLLEYFEYVIVEPSSVQLTNRGHEALISFNLINTETDEITDLGTEIINNYKENYKAQFQTESKIIRPL